MTTKSIKVQVNKAMHNFLTEIQANLRAEGKKKTSLSDILMNFAKISIENMRNEQNLHQIEQNSEPNTQDKTTIEQLKGAFNSENQVFDSKSTRNLRKSRRKLKERKRELDILKSEIDNDRTKIFHEQLELLKLKESIVAEKRAVNDKDILIYQLKREIEILEPLANREIKLSDFENLKFKQFSEIDERLKNIESGIKNSIKIGEKIYDFVLRPVEKTVFDFILPFIPAVSTALITIFMNKKDSNNQKVIAELKESLNGIPIEEKEKVFRLLGDGFKNILEE